jgi:cullin-associated NEDD8-dissociated protein 1
LVNKVKEYQVETIVDNLCANMVSEKEQLRDISSIGLKTVISELPLASSQLAGNVCKRITGKLSTAIAKVNIWRIFRIMDTNQLFIFLARGRFCPAGGS